MKAFRSTWIMTALVAMLAAYTAWEYKKAGREALGPEEKKIFSFRNDEVDQVKVVRNGETVLLVRDGADWKMKQPVEDWAETSAVDALIYSLMIQKGKTFRTESESKDIKWSDFGLEPPGSRIEVTFKGKVEALDVSSKNAFDGSYYVRLGNEILLGDHGIAQVVGRDSMQMRSKRLFRDKDGEVQSAEIVVDNGPIHDKFALKRDGDRLVVEPKPAFKVDDNRLATWLTTLLALTPTEIASDSISADEKRSDLLLKPTFTARLVYKKADGSPGDWMVTIGQDKAGDSFMYTNRRETIYKVRSAAIEPIRVGRDYFRDGRNAFKFPVEQAHEVDIASGAFRHKFTKDDSTWKMAAGETGQLNSDKLAGLFHNLTNLEAQEFLPAAAGKGFKAEQHVVVRDSKGAVLADVTWGDIYKAKQPYNRSLDFRYVKTGSEKDVMGIPAAKISSLIDAGLVTTPKAVTKKP